MSTVSPGSSSLPVASNDDISSSIKHEPEDEINHQQQQIQDHQIKQEQDDPHNVSVQDILDMEMPDAGDLADIDIDSLQIEGLTSHNVPPPHEHSSTHQTQDDTTLLPSSISDVIMPDLSENLALSSNTPISVTQTTADPTTSTEATAAATTSNGDNKDALDLHTTSSMLLDMLPSTQISSSMDDNMTDIDISTTNNQDINNIPATATTLLTEEDIQNLTRQHSLEPSQSFSTQTLPDKASEPIPPTKSPSQQFSPSSQSPALQVAPISTSPPPSQSDNPPASPTDQIVQELSATQLSSHDLDLHQASDADIVSFTQMQPHEINSIVKEIQAQQDAAAASAAAASAIEASTSSQDPSTSSVSKQDKTLLTLPDFDKSLIDQSLIDSLTLQHLDDIDMLKSKDRDILNTIPFDLILPESFHALTKNVAKQSGVSLDASSISAPSSFPDFNISKLQESLEKSSSDAAIAAASSSLPPTSITDLHDDLSQLANFDSSSLFSSVKSQIVRAQSEQLETTSAKPLPPFHAASVPHSPSAASSILPNFNFSIPDLISLDIPPTKEEEEQLLELTQPIPDDLQIPQIDSQQQEHILTTDSQSQLDQSASQISPIINTVENTPKFPPTITHSPIPFPRSKSDKSSTLQAINALNNDEYTNQSHELDNVPRVSAYARLDFPSFAFYVQTLQVILGRGAESAGCSMVDVDLGNAKAISRKHAKIFYNFGTQRFELSVLGRNGAFVDDQFIETGTTVPLRDGIKIQIGQISFTFVLPPASGAEVKATQDSIKEEDAEAIKEEKSESDEANKTIIAPEPEEAPKETPEELEKKAAPTEAASASVATTSDAAAAAAKAPKPTTAPKPNPKNPPRKEYLPEEIPEEYREKPQFSYSHLIATALRAHPEASGISLSKIYKSIQDIFPYYQYCPHGWKNSVRHNLSSNKAFKKISKEGKGWLWGIDEEYFQERERIKKKAAETSLNKARAAQAFAQAKAEKEREKERERERELEKAKEAMAQVEEAKALVLQKEAELARIQEQERINQMVAKNLLGSNGQKPGNIQISGVRIGQISPPQQQQQQQRPTQQVQQQQTQSPGPRIQSPPQSQQPQLGLLPTSASSKQQQQQQIPTAPQQHHTPPLLNATKPPSTLATSHPPTTAGTASTTKPNASSSSPAPKQYPGGAPLSGMPPFPSSLQSQFNKQQQQKAQTPQPQQQRQTQQSSSFSTKIPPSISGFPNQLLSTSKPSSGLLPTSTAGPPKQTQNMAPPMVKGPMGTVNQKGQGINASGPPNQRPVNQIPKQGPASNVPFKSQTQPSHPQPPKLQQQQAQHKQSAIQQFTGPDNRLHPPAAIQQPLTSKFSSLYNSSLLKEGGLLSDIPVLSQDPTLNPALHQLSEKAKANASSLANTVLGNSPLSAIANLSHNNSLHTLPLVGGIGPTGGLNSLSKDEKKKTIAELAREITIDRVSRPDYSNMTRESFSTTGPPPTNANNTKPSPSPAGNNAQVKKQDVPPLPRQTKPINNPAVNSGANKPKMTTGPLPPNNNRPVPASTARSTTTGTSLPSSNATAGPGSKQIPGPPVRKPGPQQQQPPQQFSKQTIPVKKPVNTFTNPVPPANTAPQSRPPQPKPQQQQPQQNFAARQNTFKMTQVPPKPSTGPSPQATLPQLQKQTSVPQMRVKPQVPNKALVSRPQPPQQQPHNGIMTNKGVVTGAPGNGLLPTNPSSPAFNSNMAPRKPVPSQQQPVRAPLPQHQINTQPPRPVQRPAPAQAPMKPTAPLKTPIPVTRPPVPVSQPKPPPPTQTIPKASSPPVAAPMQTRASPAPMTNASRSASPSGSAGPSNKPGSGLSGLNLPKETLRMLTLLSEKIKQQMQNTGQVVNQTVLTNALAIAIAQITKNGGANALNQLLQGKGQAQLVSAINTAITSSVKKNQNKTAAAAASTAKSAGPSGKSAVPASKPQKTSSSPPQSASPVTVRSVSPPAAIRNIPVPPPSLVATSMASSSSSVLPTTSISPPAPVPMPRASYPVIPNARTAGLKVPASISQPNFGALPSSVRIHGTIPTPGLATTSSTTTSSSGGGGSIGAGIQVPAVLKNGLNNNGTGMPSVPSGPTSGYVPSYPSKQQPRPQSQTAYPAQVPSTPAGPATTNVNLQKQKSVTTQQQSKPLQQQPTYKPTTPNVATNVTRPQQKAPAVTQPAPPRQVPVQRAQTSSSSPSQAQFQQPQRVNQSAAAPASQPRAPVPKNMVKPVQPPPPQQQQMPVAQNTTNRQTTPKVVNKPTPGPAPKSGSVKPSVATAPVSAPDSKKFIQTAPAVPRPQVKAPVQQPVQHMQPIVNSPASVPVSSQPSVVQTKPQPVPVAKPVAATAPTTSTSSGTRPAGNAAKDPSKQAQEIAEMLAKASKLKNPSPSIIAALKQLEAHAVKLGLPIGKLIPNAVGGSSSSSNTGNASSSLSPVSASGGQTNAQEQGGAPVSAGMKRGVDAIVSNSAGQGPVQKMVKK